MEEKYEAEIEQEESNIAKEQDNEGTALSASTFLRPISELRAPKVVCLQESDTVKDAISMMQQKRIGSVVVVKGEKIAGIFTERDVLMKVIGITEQWQSIKLSEVMTPDPQTLQSTDEVAYVLNNMQVGGYRHIPIVDQDDRPLAMVSIKNVVDWLLEFFPNEVTNLTGEPYRGTPRREGA